MDVVCARPPARLGLDATDFAADVVDVVVRRAVVDVVVGGVGPLVVPVAADPTALVASFEGD